MPDAYALITGSAGIPSHDDVEVSTVCARTLAESLFQQFFKLRAVELK